MSKNKTATILSVDALAAILTATFLLTQAMVTNFAYAASSGGGIGGGGTGTGGSTGGTGTGGSTGSNSGGGNHVTNSIHNTQT
jgi:uncharacterized membrane protein